MNKNKNIFLLIFVFVCLCTFAKNAGAPNRRPFDHVTEQSSTPIVLKYQNEAFIKNDSGCEVKDVPDLINIILYIASKHDECLASDNSERRLIVSNAQIILEKTLEIENIAPALNLVIKGNNSVFSAGENFRDDCAVKIGKGVLFSDFQFKNFKNKTICTDSNLPDNISTPPSSQKDEKKNEICSEERINEIDLITLKNSDGKFSLKLTYPEKTHIENFSATANSDKVLSLSSCKQVDKSATDVISSLFWPTSNNLSEQSCLIKISTELTGEENIDLAFKYFYKEDNYCNGIKSPSTPSPNQNLEIPVKANEEDGGACTLNPGAASNNFNILISLSYLAISLGLIARKRRH